MHIVRIVRSYLGQSQKELAVNAGIMAADICEMETREPYGCIDKYQRLSEYLGIPVHALVNDDCTLIPLSFFEKHPAREYAKASNSGNMAHGRQGEDLAFQLEQERLTVVNQSLAKLVLPFYKLGHRPGYDILSFDEQGKPICIEVKTSVDDLPDFVLTKQEYAAACRITKEGRCYQIYRFINWGRKNQTLRVHDFKAMHAANRIAPSTYVCHTEPLEPMVSGITYWREKREVSKGEMASLLSINTPMLWNYENGHRGCPVDTYLKMAQVLAVSIDDLLKVYPRELLCKM